MAQIVARIYPCLSSEENIFKGNLIIENVYRVKTLLSILCLLEMQEPVEEGRTSIAANVQVGDHGTFKREEKERKAAVRTSL